MSLVSLLLLLNVAPSSLESQSHSSIPGAALTHRSIAEVHPATGTTLPGETPTSSTGAMITTPAGNRSCPLDGTASARCSPASRPLALGETPGSGWENLTGHVGAGPVLPNDGGNFLCYDPAVGGDLLFGAVPYGYDYAGNQTWLFTNGTWTQLDPTGSPPPLYLMQLAWDPLDGYVVLFGGYTAESGSSSQTWVFDNHTWTLLAPATSPPATAQSSMFWDPVDGYLVLFGGSTPSGTSNATWTFRGGDWHELAEPVAPSARWLANMGWDGSENEGLLFGGAQLKNEVTTYLNDTWVFRAGNWTHLNSSRSPTPRSGAAISEDPALGDLLLFGGFATSAMNDLWAFAYGTWTPLPDTSPPASLRWGCWAQDPAGTGLLLYGAVLNPATEYPAYVTWDYYTVNVSVEQIPPLIEAGTPIAFSATAAAGHAPIAYAWSFGDGLNATGEIVVHAYAQAGNYTLTVTAIDVEQVTAAYSGAITVAPTLQLLAGAFPLAGTSPLTITLSAVARGGSPPYRISWNSSAGVSLSTSGGHLTISAVGEYRLVAQVEDSGGYRTNESFGASVYARSITVPLTVTVFSNTSAGIAPLPVGFGVSVLGGTAPYSFAWQFGIAGTSESWDPTMIFPRPGSQRVTLQVTDSTGATADAQELILVGSPLALSANYTATPLSASEIVQGFAFASGGSPPYSYFWSWGDGGSATVPDPTHNFTTPGIFSVAVGVIDHAGRYVSDELNVTVGPWAPLAAPGPSGAAASSLAALAAPLLTAAAAGVLIGAVIALLVRSQRVAVGKRLRRDLPSDRSPESIHRKP
ncbi:MAG: PKD domain-containing protein [Thermoplasmata archaeon]|nr:PKD domain-containing protein [Thermoplasmata archaeon]